MTASEEVGKAVPIPGGVARLLAHVETLVSPQRAHRVRTAVDRLFHDALRRLDDGTVFVLTGDIPAMWLRDSTWQLRPLLAAARDSETYEVFAAVAARQAAYVQIDPYANAFNAVPNGNCWHQDFSDQSPWVFERKYELDSLAAFLDFGLRLAKASGHHDHLNDEFFAAVRVVLDVVETEQSHIADSYRFLRTDAPMHDFLSHDGYGAPVSATGMSWSGFRPSDDACTFGYLIPANAHMAVVLKQLAQLPKSVSLSADQRERAETLSEDIRRGIDEFGLIADGTTIRYAYEVDGWGNQLAMDDANVPSLLSLPYLGWCEPNHPTYQSTRAWILSADNPQFVSGTHASGVGSPHTPQRHIWPIAMAIAALTSSDEDAMHTTLAVLERTDAGTGSIHESFHVDNPSAFTRPWFSWADMTYVHLVLRSIGAAFD